MASGRMGRESKFVFELASGSLSPPAPGWRSEKGSGRSPVALLIRICSPSGVSGRHAVEAELTEADSAVNCFLGQRTLTECERSALIAARSRSGFFWCRFLAPCTNHRCDERGIADADFWEKRHLYVSRDDNGYYDEITGSEDVEGLVCQVSPFAADDVLKVLRYENSRIVRRPAPARHGFPDIACSWGRYHRREYLPRTLRSVGQSYVGDQRASRSRPG